MTRFLLVRHGATDAVGRRLVGRLPGVPLNLLGEREVAALAARLASERVDAVYSSPLERAVATARSIATQHGLDVNVRETLTDLDFGDWTGKAFTELSEDPEFHRFNAHRSGTRPPAGEHVAEVQLRMVRELEQLARRHPEQSVAVVSHADSIRAVIGFFLGMPVDQLGRLEIGTASLSTLLLTPGWASLQSLNERPPSPDAGSSH